MRDDDIKQNAIARVDRVHNTHDAGKQKNHQQSTELTSRQHSSTFLWALGNLRDHPPPTIDQARESAPERVLVPRPPRRNCLAEGQAGGAGAGAQHPLRAPAPSSAETRLRKRHSRRGRQSLAHTASTSTPPLLERGRIGINNKIANIRAERFPCACAPFLWGLLFFFFWGGFWLGLVGIFLVFCGFLDKLDV